MSHRYVRPPLGYDYGAPEPHISKRIIELHHNQHHQTGVYGANKALAQLPGAIELVALRRLAQAPEEEGGDPEDRQIAAGPRHAQGFSAPDRAACRVQYSNG